MSVCTEPGCPKIVPVGRCDEHRRQKDRARPNTEIRRLYKTARWLRLREQIRRANHLCLRCRAEGVVEPWTDLDHVVPHRGDLGLFWDPANLEGLCHRHHSEKTGRGE